MADAVSVGASGMVYGGLGGVVAFGLKYRALLPSRYQRLMSEAALPIVLGLLLIGIVPWGGGGQVDNWAHAGGLVAGFFYGIFLRPKLLVEPATTFWSRTLHAFPSALLALGIVLGEPMLEGRMPTLRLEKNDALGVQLLVPPHWRQGAHVMGQWAFYNGLPGLGRATLAIEVIESDEPEHSARRFFEESLTPPRLGEDVLSVFPKPPVPVRVASLPAQRVEARFETRTDSTELWAFFVSKGSLTYQCVFTFPAKYPRYEAVVRKLVDSLAFGETRELRQARSRALLFPNSSWALGSLGESLRRHGELKAAISALREALRVKAGQPQVQTQLAFALLQNGDMEEGCAASARAVSQSPLSIEALESQARCEVSRGAPHIALTHIQSALTLAPGDERLKEVAARLQAAIEQAPSFAPGAPRKD
jgi:Flp pilus assembly protein TadD